MIKGSVAQIPIYKVVNSKRQVVTGSSSLVQAKRMADWRNEQIRKQRQGEFTIMGQLPAKKETFSVKSSIGYRVPGGWVKGVYLREVIVEDRAEAVRMTNQRKFLSRF